MDTGLMQAAWRREIARMIALLLVFGVAGGLLGHVWAGLVMALAICLALQLRMLRWLSRWVVHPKRVDLPDPTGVWGEVFEQLLEMQKRNRKRKKRLAAIVAEFQSSTAALPDGAVVMSSRGEIVWFNSSAQILLGLRSPQDVGQRIANLVRHPSFANYLAAEQFESDVEVISPINEHVTLAMRIIPYGEGQRLLIVRDVSEHRRLEVMRRDFVSNASHELRTPLTVLRGYLDMMEPDTRGKGALLEWKTPIGEMRAQATRMESLITDLLKLARLESDSSVARQELIDVPHLLHRIAEDTRRLSPDRHTVEAAIEADIKLLGRDSEFHSLCQNLLQNAIQYSPDGGAVRLRWWGDEDGAHLSVADSGLGIDEADIPRLTERFYRVDVARSRSRGGTGLGLAIVKHALEHHEARLEIISQPGIGSTFICHFPAHRVQRAQPMVVNG